MTKHDLEDRHVAGVKETRDALLRRARRDAVPLRRVFVQTPRALAADPQNLAGPLATFVRRRDERGLKAYLLIVAATSSGDAEEGWSTTHPLPVWSRAFATTEHVSSPAAASTATSKILKRLEDRQLISRSRRGRRGRITLLREDGSGEAYERPKGNDLQERFFNLPHAFWLDGWCDELSLPAVTMLLVALSETGKKKSHFELPTEKMQAWYGWSADTAERGFHELRKHGLLPRERRQRPEPLSPTGTSMVNRYYPAPPFGTGPTDDDRAQAALHGWEIS